MLKISYLIQILLIILAAQIPEYYICGMKKNILFAHAVLLLLSGPVYAQACPILSADGHGGTETAEYTHNTKDKAGKTISAYTISKEETKRFWTQRYLSVSLPLRNLKVTSPYGYRRDPFTGKKRFHGGIDLHARGEKALAMMAGVVVQVGENSASGKYVVLRHGNYLVSYCHLSRILTVTGRQVRPAEPVGITGSTGRSTGEHLHITCKLNGRSVNPWMLIRHITSVRKECIEALARLQ